MFFYRINNLYNICRKFFFDFFFKLTAFPNVIKLLLTINREKKKTFLF